MDPVLMSATFAPAGMSLRGAEGGAELGRAAFAALSAQREGSGAGSGGQYLGLPKAWSKEHDALLQTLREQQDKHQRMVLQMFQDQFSFVSRSIMSAGSNATASPAATATFEAVESYGEQEVHAWVSKSSAEDPGPGPEESDATKALRMSLNRVSSVDSHPPTSPEDVPPTPAHVQLINSAQRKLSLNAAQRKFSAAAKSGRGSMTRSLSPEGEERARKPRWGCLQTAAQRLEKSRQFQLTFQFLIVFSGILLGVQQDRLARHLGQTLTPVDTTVDGLFAVVFCFEILVRIVASGGFFYSIGNKDVCWNLFDSLIVFAEVVEKFFKFVLSSSFVNVSTGRLFRMVRFVRIVRVLRVLRFFQDLRVMILSIMGSLRPLLFAILLLSVIIYVASVCLMHFVTDHLLWLQEQGGQESVAFKSLTEHFGTLTTTAYTLFLSISGGADWGVVCYPLWDISPALGSGFVLYICFTMFCVLNIITGIFIEEANTKTCEDEDHMLVRELDKRRRFIAEAKRFFEEADKDGSGQLTWPEFQEILKNVRMQKLLERLGIDVQACGAKNVFEMFDFDGNGVIEVTEFSSGLKRFRGGARSIEIAGMRFEQQKLLREVGSISRSCAELVNSLRPGSVAIGPGLEFEGMNSEEPVTVEEPKAKKHCL